MITKTYEQLMEQETKRKEYRDAYNKRPEVKAKRAAYMKERNQMGRELLRMFKAGDLQMAPTGGTRVDMGTGKVEEVVEQY